MKQIFDPDKRIMQYFKLVGLDKEIRICDGLHLKQLEGVSKKKVFPNLKERQEQQYSATLKHLTRLKDTFVEALKETEQGLEKAGEIEISKEYNADDAFKYLNEAIDKIKRYIREMEESSGTKNV